MSNKVQRNFKCPCGSGKKFKRCHGDEVVLTQQRQAKSEMLRQEQMKRRVALTDAVGDFPMGLGLV